MTRLAASMICSIGTIEHADLDFNHNTKREVTRKLQADNRMTPGFTVDATLGNSRHPESVALLGPCCRLLPFRVRLDYVQAKKQTYDFYLRKSCAGHLDRDDFLAGFLALDSVAAVSTFPFCAQVAVSPRDDDASDRPLTSLCRQSVIHEFAQFQKIGIIHPSFPTSCQPLGIQRPPLMVTTGWLSYEISSRDVCAECNSR